MAASMDKLFTREFETKNGEIMTINQCEIGDVGCVVWDAALVLASYLETADWINDNGENSLSNSSVLELGAGTGLVGLQASHLGAIVQITDLQDFIPLIQLNVDENKSVLHGKAEAKALKWGEEVEKFLPAPDFILFADCIYYEEGVEPLVETLAQLSGEKTCVYCCYEERLTGNKPKLQAKFFQLMEEHFNHEEIPLDRHDETYRSEDIHIIRFSKR